MYKTAKNGFLRFFLQLSIDYLLIYYKNIKIKVLNASNEIQPEVLPRSHPAQASLSAQYRDLFLAGINKILLSA
jgi:hypothetical protein